MLCTVFDALAIPWLMASSKLVGDSALISIIFTTDISLSFIEYRYIHLNHSIRIMPQALALPNHPQQAVIIAVLKIEHAVVGFMQVIAYFAGQLLIRKGKDGFGFILFHVDYPL